MITPQEMEDKIIELANELDNPQMGIVYFDGITVSEMIKRAWYLED